MSSLLFTLAVETSIRAAILVAAMALILTLFRIRSSGTRHAAWATVLAVMLLMPVLTRFAPQIRVPVPESLGPLVPVPGPPLIDSPLPALPSSLTSGQRGATTSPVAPPALAPGNDAPVTPTAPVRWNDIGLVAYVAGLSFFLVRLVIGLRQLSTIRGRSQRVTPAPGEIAWECSLVATPVTIGLLAPRVILPVAWREWSPETLTAVLAHERAHATRCDPLIAVLARLNSAIFWFHPLAWWLERKLATLAEHACDDAAVTQVARRQYAETLLDIAATVRRHQGRLVWQGVGVDGDGRLGQRIDRVLSEAASPRPSRLRVAAAGMSCALAIVAVIACRQEQGVPPLREEPTLAAELKVRAARSAEYRAAEQMTLTEAASLEKTLEQNPEDMATREKLLTFYRWTGKNTQPWADNVAARRRHALWLVEHHPESNLVMSALVTKATDPAGYAQLSNRWVALSAPANVDPKVLSNAAWFFRQSDIRKAEELLLRGRAGVTGQDPQQQWAFRLGDLYASALRPPPWESQDPAASAWAKQRLDESTDAAVLFAAGERVFYAAQARELGRAYIERASKMNAPAAQRAREWIRLIDSEQRNPGAAFKGAPTSEWAGIVAKSTGITRLNQLAALADSAYGMAEYYDWRAKQPAGSKDASPNVEEDKRKAGEGFANAKKYTSEMLELAPSLTGEGVGETAFRAHITAGLVSLREGDRREAVRHMMEAAKLPAPAGLVVGRWASGNEYRLVFYLLKNGERQTIVDYFERAAQGRDEARRKVMLASAAAIRDGRMPEHYQYLVGSGSL